jgi:anion-transporting  ArsA/GET3 family ATPase
MPELLQDWTRALMRIVLKYQPVAGAGVLGEQLLTLSKRLTAVRSLLADAASTAFVVVTRAATLPMSETVRLLRALSRLGIASPALVVNAVGGGTCGRCRARRSAEARVMRALGGQAGRLMPPRVVFAPSVMPPPTTPDTLRRWHARWTCHAE